MLSGGSSDCHFQCPQKRGSGQRTGQEEEYWDTCPLSATDTQGDKGKSGPLSGSQFPLCQRSVLAWVPDFLALRSGPGIWWWVAA